MTKRIFALCAAIALTVSLAPSANAVETTQPPIGGAIATNQEVAAPIAPPASAKKKCTYMCVQSTLPTIEQDAFFVNDDSDLLMFTDTEIILRDLDTKTTQTSRSIPAGLDVETIKGALARETNDFFFYAATSSGNQGRVYRLDTTNLQLYPITPVSPTHSLDFPFARGLYAAPDGSGFFLIHSSGSDRYLCQFDENGTEQACSSSFGAGSAVSRIFANQAGNLLFVMGDTDKRFAFDVDNNLAKTSETISELSSREVDFEIGAQTSNGDMVFADRFDEGNMGGKTRIYQIHMDGYLVDSYDIRGEFNVSAMNAPSADPSSVYVLANSLDRRGVSNRFATMFKVATVLGSGNLTVKKSMKIQQNADSFLPSNLTSDSEGRYLLAMGDAVNTSVIPIHAQGSIRVYSTSNYDLCLSAGWNLTWNYVNLAPGKSLTEYAVMYKAPGRKSKWEVSATLSADGTRSVSFTRGVAGGRTKIVPKGIKVNYAEAPALNELVGALRPGQPQPGC